MFIDFRNVRLYADGAGLIYARFAFCQVILCICLGEVKSLMVHVLEQLTSLNVIYTGWKI